MNRYVDDLLLLRPASYWSLFMLLGALLGGVLLLLTVLRQLMCIILT